jgi:hypothetical protein
MLDDRAQSARLSAIACCALALGVLAYLTDRSATHATLIPSVPALAGTQLFGVLAQWLPSFVHPFAFGLLTAAALPAALRPRLLGCFAWFVVNLAFEIGQHRRISGPIADALQNVLGPGSLSRALARYFIRGTFDVFDIAAAAAGALAAAGVLLWVHHRPERTRGT